MNPRDELPATLTSPFLCALHTLVKTENGVTDAVSWLISRNQDESPSLRHEAHTLPFQDRGMQKASVLH